MIELGLMRLLDENRRAANNEDAEQRMIMYGAITGVLRLAAFTLWQFTDDTSVTMSDQGLIHLHAVLNAPFWRRIPRILWQLNISSDASIV